MLRRSTNAESCPTCSWVCHVLREDLDLSEAIPIADRDKALEECVAAAMWIPAGPWSGPLMPDGIGLLVLQGLLAGCCWDMARKNWLSPNSCRPEASPWLLQRRGTATAPAESDPRGLGLPAGQDPAPLSHSGGSAPR